jgi:hypothetical protein
LEPTLPFFSLIFGGMEILSCFHLDMRSLVPTGPLELLEPELDRAASDLRLLSIIQGKLDLLQSLHQSLQILLESMPLIFGVIVRRRTRRRKRSQWRGLTEGSQCFASSDTARSVLPLLCHPHILLGLTSHT